MSKYNISVSVKLSNNEIKNRIKLFSEIASAEIINDSTNSLKNFFSEIKIDFDSSVKQSLISIFREVGNKKVTPIQDQYLVKIALKDDRLYILLNVSHGQNVL